MNELLIILALTLVNALFAGAEIAVLSVRKTRLAELEGEGSKGAAAVSRLRHNPEIFLATVQVGISVVTSAQSVYAGSTLVERLTPMLAAVPALAPFASGLASGIVVASISSLSIVLGELVPKSLALRASETYALLIGRPLEVLSWITRPFVALLTAASNVVLRVFGDRTTFTESRLSRAELQQIVEDATTTGSVDPKAGEIASRAIEFSTLDAYTVMVPRVDIVWLSRQADAADVARAAAGGHSRLPVWDGSPENVVGFANVRDLLAAAALGQPMRVDDHLHPIPFIPETMSAPDALRRLQQERCHLTMVLDELGNVAGLLTIEDLVEELVGAILSENDRPEAAIVREADGSWVAAGDVTVHAANRELGIDLPEGEYATLAGLCIDLAGEIPAAGAVLNTPDGLVLEVVEATPRRVKRVRIRRPP